MEAPGLMRQNNSRNGQFYLLVICIFSATEENQILHHCLLQGTKTTNIPSQDLLQTSPKTCLTTSTPPHRLRHISSPSPDSLMSAHSISAHQPSLPGSHAPPTLPTCSPRLLGRGGDVPQARDRRVQVQRVVRCLMREYVPLNELKTVRSSVLQSHLSHLTAWWPRMHRSYPTAKHRSGLTSRKACHNQFLRPLWFNVY